MSATGSTAKDVDVGVDVSKAGLILQEVVLVLFLALSADYLVTRKKGHPGQMARLMRWSLTLTLAAVVLGLVRCIYRIIELKEGYFGPNFRHEPAFITLEGG